MMSATEDQEMTHRARLEEHEREAAAWLSARPPPPDTSALYDALLKLPYLRDLDVHHTEYVSKTEQTLKTTFCLGGGRLPLPLPPSPATCACESLSGAAVEKIYLSGSVRECTDVRLFAEEVSDIDVMLQVGPLDVAGLRGQRKAGRQTGATVGGQAGHRISVTQERTPQPGFVLLYHRPLASCRHGGPLPLDARRIVGLMDSFRRQMTSQPSSQSGPSVATTIQDIFKDPKSIDLVACVTCPIWPNEEFGSRQRPSGFPDAELVARLCRTPAFLVPVGFKGSATEDLEWRLSFSRHEYIAYRSMTDKQRVCLTTLKHCRAVIGEAVKPLKSYYLKTALMWLVESRAADQWTLETMHDSLLLILRFLEVCLRRDYMPCYFWPEVNLLASRSAEEKAEMTEAVEELRRRLLPAVLALLADWLGQSATELADSLLGDGRRMSEEEFVARTAVSGISELLDGDWRPLNVLKDLVLNGKVRPYGKLPKLPLCSALSLGIEAGRQYNRSMKQNPLGSQDASNIIGVLQPLLDLAQQVREPEEPEDSWMKEH